MERAAEGAEVVGEISDVHIKVGGIDFQPREEFSAEAVGELAELDQVAAVGRDVGRDSCDDAGLVGGGELEDESGADWF